MKDRKKFWKFFGRFISHRKPIELRLFNIIVFTAMIGVIATLVMSLFIKTPQYQNFVSVSCTAVLIFSFYLANWKGHFKIASGLILIVVTLVLYPMLFFYGGGSTGGMASWFSLGIIYTFLITDGLFTVFILVPQVIVIIACYMLEYFGIIEVHQFPGEFYRFFDIIQCLLMLGFIVGLIHRFQKKIYNKSIYRYTKTNRALNEAKNLEDKARRAKSDFLSNVGHEIRTPINAVLGMSEMILRESTDESITKYAVDISKSGQTLLSMINDVLEISTIESGKIELNYKDYYLADIITKCYRKVKDKANAKGLELYVTCDKDLPSSLYGDASRIQQIFVNILTNAVQYTNSGRIDFSVGGTISEDGVLLRADIRDTGIGIRRENLDRIFEKFEQLDVHHDKVEGTGLGLSISKKIVEYMGGRIEVSSTYGKGSDFTVIIPQQISDISPVGEFDVNDYSSKNPKIYHQSFEAPDANILAVDDVDINLVIFTNLLKETKLNIDTASSGMEALELSAKKHYDVIFMDHIMPEMDGIQTLKEIRRMDDSPNKDTPVVMLTANALAGVRDEYIKAGFNDYIAKPLDGKFLESVLLKYLPSKYVKLLK